MNQELDLDFAFGQLFGDNRSTFVKQTRKSDNTSSEERELRDFRRMIMGRVDFRSSIKLSME